MSHSSIRGVRLMYDEDESRHKLGVNNTCCMLLFFPLCDLLALSETDSQSSELPE